MRGRRWGAGLGVCVLCMLLGCRTIGPIPDDPTHQHGSVSIPAHEEQDVYYRVPFTSPPNLSIKTTFNDCLLVEQKADHFRVKNPESFSREVTWEARGVTAPQYAVVPGPGDPATPPRPAAKPTGFAKDVN